MNAWTDEQLRAYLRGSLAAAEMDAIEAAFTADPSLTDRMLRLAETDDGSSADALVRDAFAPVEALAVPPRLTAALNEATPVATNIVDFAAAKSARQLPRWGWPQLSAMAASLALGVFVGQGYLTGSNQTDNLVVASAEGPSFAPQLEAMLAKAGSGAKRPIDGLGEAEVVISFRNGDGQLCRQFQISSANRVTDGVSCREGDRWSVEALASRAAAGTELSTASGEAAPAVLAAVDAIIVGDVIVGAAEARALADN